ncbi:excisionase family DNA-binding protein [Rhodococcus hoagii]|nr:excisionase family DNA-binding protein [Prescottella equi]NKZ84587.1 excisionase family DNA-binding protein [Prescottella equi]
MTDYNIIARLGSSPEPIEDRALALVDAFAEYGASVGPLGNGTAELTITVPADNIRQAIDTGFALLADRGVQPTSIEAMTTEDWDRGHAIDGSDEMLSVTQAADLLGVSRQRVLQRISEGTIAARKVGRAWAIPRGALQAA